MMAATVTGQPDQAGIDLSRRAEAYAALARSYAVDGDILGAVLATWAADIHALEALLWENGLAAAPDPQDQLRVVAEAVMDSLSASPDGASPASARDLVEHARDAMAAAFDASVHELLAERLMSLDHLDDLNEVEKDWDPRRVGMAGRDTARRMDGRSVTELVADLRVTASDCMAVARVMSAAGRTLDAWHHVRLSDTATLEAYLLDAALRSGDARLATVDLRWDLAASVMAELPDDPDDLADAIARARQRLAGVVGLAESDALLGQFEPVTPSPA